MYSINPKHLLYENGEKTSNQEGEQLFAKQLGYIEITSGHIVACDPFVSEGDQSFSKKIHLGKYPILFMVKRLESGDERVAYAMINKPASNRMGACHKSRAGTQTFERRRVLRLRCKYGYGLFYGC
ncbi:DUF4241 domain-containing protein [Bacillus sp. 28A-2]|uniref:DUF4241 domain-containing protein n=1 Tax=Bacillus sp. 28A-2 TaxID=2772252 RepID=UPI00168D93CB|nr:DUF4241 domain-containing protein [Bacillus sp. 28A-2]